MLKLPISLDAIPNNSAIGMKAKLCQWHSLTHNSDTSVVASGSPSNPIAFFGRKDRRRERAKTVSGRLQLLEEINTWQKQKKRERESAFPLAWVERRMRVFLPSESLAAATANESKKEKTGSGPGMGDTGKEGTWARNQRAGNQSAGMTRSKTSPPPPPRRSHSTFTREWGDKWTVTCSDDAKSLCKSLNFRNTSSSFGTHSLLKGRLWVMATAIPSLDRPSSLPHPALLDGANPFKLLLTYALSPSLFGSYLRMYYCSRSSV